MANSKYSVLRRSSDFDKIRANGRKVSAQKWMFFSYINNELDQNRWGWTVSSKIGSAVTRNRLKRWCRVCIQSELIAGSKTDDSIINKDINVVFRPIKIEFYRSLKFKEFEKAFFETWGRLQKSS